MTLHKGKPSGTNKTNVKTTGSPVAMTGKKMKADKRLTSKYTANDENIADEIKTKHDNRNVNKLHATNAGGYKN